MKELISYILQSNLYILVFLFCYQVGFRKSTNYRFNRIYLLMSSSASLLLPLVSIPNFRTISNLKGFQIFLDEIVAPVNTAVENSLIETNSISTMQIILSIYLIGIIFSIIKLIFSFIKLKKLNTTCKVKNGYFEIPNSYDAFSFLNQIYIGSEINEHDKAIIFKHEQVHIRKLHSIDLVFSRILEILFWWNPIIYLLKKYLIEQHEYEADDKSCIDSKAYTYLLLQQKFQINHLTFTHHFNSNTNLKSRIMRLKNQETKNISKGAILFTFIILGVCFLGNQNLNSANTNMINNEYESPTIVQNDSIFDIVDEMPVFNNEENGLMQFVGKNTIYPAEALKKKITGRVFVTFVVGLEGQVEDVKILRGTNPLLDQAALDVVKKIPNFEKPGKQDGKAVKVRYNIPLNFNLKK